MHVVDSPEQRPEASAVSDTNEAPNRADARYIYVIVPALREVGPVKGAVAACNYLARRAHTTLVVAKPGDASELRLDSEVRVMKLGEGGGWLHRIVQLRKQYRSHARVPVSISMCLSADLLNLFMVGCAHRIVSVRGNLFKNYYYDYGPIGIVIAFLHTVLLHGFERVLSMSNAMTRLLRRFGLTRVSLVRNFIDEEAVAAARLPRRPTSHMRRAVVFGFVGSMTERKQPRLLIETLSELIKSGESARLRLIGDGPHPPTRARATNSE